MALDRRAIAAQAVGVIAVRSPRGTDSRRSRDRALAISKRAIPALQALVQSGALTLRDGEDLARLSPQRQAELVSEGVEACRREVLRTRAIERWSSLRDRIELALIDFANRQTPATDGRLFARRDRVAYVPEQTQRQLDHDRHALADFIASRLCSGNPSPRSKS